MSSANSDISSTYDTQIKDQACKVVEGQKEFSLYKLERGLVSMNVKIPAGNVFR